MEQREPEENQTTETEPEVAELDDIETLKQALNEQKKQAEANLAGWQRAQADFINYKRRCTQEKEEISKFANTTLMLNLLPTLDDLERAIASIPAHKAKPGWVEGIKLVKHNLWTTLETQGLSPIKALGKPFDPNLHEAAMQGKGKEDIVVGELLKGYRLHDRVIRPAKVVVGNGEEEEKKEE